MHLYLIRRKERAGHDEIDAMVVRAHTDLAARWIAADAAMDEESPAWSDENRSTVFDLGVAKGLRDDREEVVLFHALYG